MPELPRAPVFLTQEAIEWASRCPGGDGKVDHFGGTFELEIRQIFEASDFPSDVFPPELNEREEALRKELEAKQRR